MATFRLTVLGTTDLHSHILDWDYFTDRPYSDSHGNHVGLARLSTLINQVRADRGPATTLTVDSGDTIEGTPLAYYFARIEPDAPHPMALAMNAIGYDAAAIGNHEFNYGLGALERFADQVRHPMLCANATGFTPYLLKKLDTDGPPLTVGILGLVTPGCAIWDKSHLDGKVSINGVVEQAAVSVPELRAAGADIVVVLCHSGADASSSYGDALPWPENAAGLLAEKVAGIDAILVGHAHVEISSRQVANETTNQSVLLSEPLKWGMRLSVLTLDLVHDGTWRVASSNAELLDARSADEDPAIRQLIGQQHETVRAYVNGVIGSCARELSAARARFEAGPVIDLINHVQALAVQRALGDATPVLGVAAAFNASATIPAGPVTVRDIAALYNYDNTLVGIAISGRQLRDYLEHAARYFKTVTGPGPYAAGQLTNAVTPQAPKGTPDYNYDMISGLDAPLAYDVDLTRPVGSRIVRLEYDSKPVNDAQRFVLAMNNYRQAGGGDYPWVREAPVLYDELAETRQLIIDWVREIGTIDPATFAHCAWRLVANGEPLLFA
jgi:2',3'-cyclic-nucleotide 2'-phosphodiesterase/3'-nucleotidase